MTCTRKARFARRRQSGAIRAWRLRSRRCRRRRCVRSGLNRAPSVELSSTQRPREHLDVDGVGLDPRQVKRTELLPRRRSVHERDCRGVRCRARSPRPRQGSPRLLLRRRARVPRFLAKMRQLYPQHFAFVCLGLSLGHRPSTLRPLRRSGPTPDFLPKEGVLLVAGPIPTARS